MNKLLIGGAITMFGFAGKLFMDDKRKENEKAEYAKQRKIEIAAYEKTERTRKANEEADKNKINHIEAERTRLFSSIITSSNNSIKGYRIIQHLRMVSITDENCKTIAEGKFLLAVEEAGGNGVINMQIRPHHGGYFSVQGDAVLIEPLLKEGS